MMRPSFFAVGRFNRRLIKGHGLLDRDVSRLFAMPDIVNHGYRTKCRFS